MIISFELEDLPIMDYLQIKDIGSLGLCSKKFNVLVKRNVRCMYGFASIHLENINKYTNLQELRLEKFSLQSKLDLLFCLKQCIHLKTLVLSRLKLGNEGIFVLTKILPHLTHLKTLDLNSNFITEEGFYILFPVLYPIENLDISCNWIQNFSSFKYLSPQINYLGLDWIRMKPMAVENLISNLSRLQKITKLKIGINHLSSSCWNQIQQNLITTNLTFLSLCNNYIGDEGLQTLISNNKNYPKLQHLDLSFNHITSKGCTDFFQCLKLNKNFCPNLSELNLSDNEIAAGISTIALVIQELETLTHLDLSGNLLGNKEMKIWTDIGISQWLTSLNLSSNYVGDKGICLFLEKIKDRNSQFKKLLVNENHIGRMGYKKLKESNIWHWECQGNFFEPFQVVVS